MKRRSDTSRGCSKRGPSKARPASPSRKPKKVLIIGGGPTGLTLAASIAEHAQMHDLKDISVQVFEMRLEGGDTSPLSWRSFNEPTRNKPIRRREQIVSLQDDVCDLFKSHSKSTREAFEGSAIWPSCQNVAIRDCEDRLLKRCSEKDMKEYVTLHQLPSDLATAVRNGNPRASNLFREWLERQEYDILVGADGANSIVRRMHAKTGDASNEQESQNSSGGSASRPVQGFGQINYLATKQKGLSKDYAIGIAFEYDKSWSPQPESLNILITLAQNRYLFNSSENGRRGYVNVRLTKKEYDTLIEAADGPCKFSAPCVLYDCYKRVPQDVIQIYEVDHALRKTIEEGLRLFGIPKELLTTVVAFELNPAYASVFHAAGNDGKDALLIGDAAMSHHFWPGRGLNTGLKSAAGAARAIISAHLEQDTQPFQKYDEFMQALRNREMQGRSASMMTVGEAPALPEHLDAPNEAINSAHDWADPEASKLITRIKEWRNFLEARSDWPHPHCSDADIESKFNGSQRPNPYVMKVMNDSASQSAGKFQVLWGWPAGARSGGNEVFPDEYLPDSLAKVYDAQQNMAVADQEKAERWKVVQQKVKQHNLKVSLVKNTEQFHQRTCAEQDFAEQESSNPLAFYDMVLKVNNFSDLWKDGWPLHLTDEFSSEEGWHGVPVVILGDFKRGKTWLLSKLTRSPFPSSAVMHTPGLCARQVSVNKKKLLVLDMKGENTPLDTISEEALTEKKAEESFMRDIICEISDAFIYVVNSVGSSEQLTLFRLARELRTRSKGLPMIIVVHNLRQLQTKCHMDKAVEEIRKMYEQQGLEAIPEEISIESGKQEIRYLEASRIKGNHNSSTGDAAAFQSRHFILGAEGSEAGSGNEFVVEKIRRMLLDVMPTSSELSLTDLIGEAARSRLPAYVTGHPTVRFYDKALKAEEDLERGESIKLRRMDLGTFVSVKTDTSTRGTYRPRYSVSESDTHVFLRVCLPGFEKSDIKKMVQWQRERDGVAVHIKSQGRKSFITEIEREIESTATSNEIDEIIRVSQMLQDFNPTKPTFENGVLCLSWVKASSSTMSFDDSW